MNFDIIIPEKLNDLTLGQWQRVVELETSDKVSREFYIRKVLEIIYGIDGDNLEKIKASDVELMMDAVTKTIEQKPEFQTRFILKGVEYGLIPNFDDMTFGEFVDLEEYQGKGGGDAETPESHPEDYHKLMSILFRPIIAKQSGRRYTIEPYKGSGDLSGMPLGVAMGVLAFFLTIGSQLISDTLNSLTEEEAGRLRRSLMRKNGDGTFQSILSPRETSSEPTRQQRRTSTRRSHGSHSKRTRTN